MVNSSEWSCLKIRFYRHECIFCFSILSMEDEWRMMNDEWWMMNVKGWWFQAAEGLWGWTDRWRNEQTNGH